MLSWNTLTWSNSHIRFVHYGRDQYWLKVNHQESCIGNWIQLLLTRDEYAKDVGNYDCTMMVVSWNRQILWILHRTVVDLNNRWYDDKLSFYRTMSTLCYPFFCNWICINTSKLHNSLLPYVDLVYVPMDAMVLYASYTKTLHWREYDSFRYTRPQPSRPIKHRKQKMKEYTGC